jgi:hypothetical protein
MSSEKWGRRHERPTAEIRALAAEAVGSLRLISESSGQLTRSTGCDHALSNINKLITTLPN